MQMKELVQFFGSDERGKAVQQIAALESPSFVLKKLAEWMTSRPNKDDEWYHLAAHLRAKAYEAEGAGL